MEFLCIPPALLPLQFVLRFLLLWLLRLRPARTGSSWPSRLGRTVDGRREPGWCVLADIFDNFLPLLPFLRLMFLRLRLMLLRR